MKELNEMELKEVDGGNPIAEWLLFKIIDNVIEYYTSGQYLRDQVRLGDSAAYASLQYN
jgi:hypothetical protein